MASFAPLMQAKNGLFAYGRIAPHVDTLLTRRIKQNIMATKFKKVH